MTGALIAGIVPQRVMYTQWFTELSMFVAINTVLYLTLALIKLLPKAYLSDWVNHRNRRSETRSIYPAGFARVTAERSPGLHVHHRAETGGSFQGPTETITETSADVTYHCRLALLEHAQRCGNVSEACRAAGVSRSRYYEWKRAASRYGSQALKPSDLVRRAPNATPSHVVERLLSLALLEPTLGARRLADRLADEGSLIAASTAQKYLNKYDLGTRDERLARAGLVEAPVVTRWDERSTASFRRDATPARCDTPAG